MEKVRIIHAASKINDFEEKIVITQEFDIAAKDYFTSGFDIVSDTTHEINIPSGFPLDYVFNRENI